MEMGGTSTEMDAAMEMEMKAGELAAFLINFSKRKRINSNPRLNSRLNSPYYRLYSPIKLPNLID
jgi:hypothetical protein